MQNLAAEHVSKCHAAAPGTIQSLPEDTHRFIYALVAVMNMNRNHAQVPDYKRITALLNAVTRW